MQPGDTDMKTFFAFLFLLPSLLFGEGPGIWTQVQQTRQTHYNILDYGAVADGVTDNRIPIQNAINTASSAGGGTVYVPKGTFAVGTNGAGIGLSLPNNVYLSGGGWDSELLMTKTNCNAIATSSSWRTQADMDAGNTNICISNLKIRYETCMDGVGIGIVLGGLSSGEVRNVWIDNVGGYSLYVAKNNDVPLVEGKYSDNILVTGCRITGVRDVGIELMGARDSIISDTFISGPGMGTGLSVGLAIWGGSHHCQFSGIHIEGIGASNNLNAITVQPNNHTNVLFMETTNNVISEVVAKNIKAPIVIGGGTYGKRVWTTKISNSQFFGQTTNDTITSAIKVVYAIGAEINGCLFDTFSGKGLKVSHTSDVADQTTVTNLSIVNCQFRNVDSLEIYGLQDFRFLGNWIYNVPSAAAMYLYGVQECLIANNRISDIGTSGNSIGISLNIGGGTQTRNCTNIVVVGNKFDDSRATKYVNIGLALNNATDYVLAVGNDVKGAKVGASEVYDGSTGTHNSLLSNYSGTYRGFNLQSGFIVLDNGMAVVFRDSANTPRSVLYVDGSDNTQLSATGTSGNITLGPRGATKVTVYGSDGTTGIAGPTISTNGMQTGAPTAGTAATWKLGSIVTNAVTVSTTNYIQLQIGSRTIKVPICDD